MLPKNTTSGRCERSEASPLEPERPFRATLTCRKPAGQCHFVTALSRKYHRLRHTSQLSLAYLQG